MDGIRRSQMLLATVPIFLIVLSCAPIAYQTTAGDTSRTMPRWACPTNTPLPYGPDGPPKQVTELCATPVGGGAEECKTKRTDYVIWEQEYSGLGSPPPPPTPYTKTGVTFNLGQIVNLGDGALDVQLSVEPTGTMSGTMRLYRLLTTWTNHRDTAIPLAPWRQLVITEIRDAGGRSIAGDWTLTGASIELAGEARADAYGMLQLPAGTSAIVTPILAPDGIVATAELRLDSSSAAEATPADAEDATSPTAEAIVADGQLRIRFVAVQESSCSFPGTIGASYADAARNIIPPDVPPGTDALVAFGLSQLGRPYCWGGYGWNSCDGGGVTSSCAAQGGPPCWDCAGLTWGAYQSIGVNISHGTWNQALYPEVSAADALPGDILLFSAVDYGGRDARVTHAGLYAGDLDGDGKADMVEACCEEEGVRTVPDVFHNGYYGPKLVLIVRPPREGGR